jgi:CspA family cold shock protein
MAADVRRQRRMLGDDGIVAVKAVVREWHSDEGWGVVEAPQVPGGCWVGFGQVAVAGYRSLHARQEVALEWEPSAQDGYAYRALRVWPWGADPVQPAPTAPAGNAYSSTLTLTFDAPPIESDENHHSPGEAG